MMRYCEESKHWTTIEEELSGRGVRHYKSLMQLFGWKGAVFCFLRDFYLGLYLYKSISISLSLSVCVYYMYIYTQTHI